jgi:gliding motility-associated-like protein
VLDGSASVGAAGGYVWYELPSNTTVAITPTMVITPATGASTFVLQAIASVSTCFAFDTVVVNSLPLPDVDAGPSFTIPVYGTVTIGGNPTSTTGQSFTWTPSFTLNDGTIQNPVASNTVSTVYTVMVTDANGCRAFDTVRVDIYPEIKIPNGFSPNADGRNDTWIIDNINQFPEAIVEVYNRWGELLFMSPPGYPVPFDGRYNGKPLPVGTYYYIINLNHPAYLKPYTGPLTIFR